MPADVATWAIDTLSRPRATASAAVASRICQVEDIDVAIIGGGPAGLQTALVLARTRKNVVVFDVPAPPRNDASHGVHNFVGLDGLRPQEIRDRAWEQMDVDESARLVRLAVQSVTSAEDSNTFVVGTNVGTWSARHLVLAYGYRDVLPDISAEQQQMFHDLGVSLDVGDIVALEHEGGKLRRAALDTGETALVGTLLWTPDEEPAPLVSGLVVGLGSGLDDNGDVQGWMGGIESANAGGMAATMIVAEWRVPSMAVCV